MTIIANNTATRFITVMCAAFILTACSSSPNSSFYLLKAKASGSGENITVDFDQSIIVGPIALPDYLKREEIIFRSEAHQVTVAEYHRWAEPLDRRITTLIASNLSSRFGAEKVIDYYANFTSNPDITVRVRISEFGPTTSGEVELLATWEIASRNTREPALFSADISTSVASGAATADDVAAAVDAMNRALNELSDDIAESILTSSS